MQNTGCRLDVLKALNFLRTGSPVYRWRRPSAASTTVGGRLRRPPTVVDSIVVDGEIYGAIYGTISPTIHGTINGTINPSHT